MNKLINVYLFPVYVIAAVAVALLGVHIIESLAPFRGGATLANTAGLSFAMMLMMGAGACMHQSARNFIDTMNEE